MSCWRSGKLQERVESGRSGIEIELAEAIAAQHGMRQFRSLPARIFN